MKTMIEYLDELRERQNLPSDRQLAFYLGLKKQAVSKWKVRGYSVDPDTAWKIAEGIGADPLEVIAASEIERAKRNHNDEMTRTWARRLRDLGAALSLVFAGFFALQAAALPLAGAAWQCILCQIESARLTAHRHRRRATLIRPKLRQYLDFFAIVRGTQYAKLF